MTVREGELLESAHRELRLRGGEMVGELRREGFLRQSILQDGYGPLEITQDMLCVPEKRRRRNVTGIRLQSSRDCVRGGAEQRENEDA